MTPETKQVPAGYFRRSRTSSRETIPLRLSPNGTRVPVRNADPTVRSDESVERQPTADPQLATPAAVTKHAGEDRSIVGILPYLVVLVCTVAGVYVAWHQGSAGGGEGGVVGGIALLVAAVMRLVLPARLVGLLGTRNRAIDVLTLAIFGGGLLIAGLVLPR